MSSRLLDVGEATVWGIDVSLERLHLSAIARDGAFTYNAAQLRDKLAKPSVRPSQGEQLHQILERGRGFMRRWAELYPPAMVYVELATGRFPKPMLTACCGILAAAANVSPKVGRVPSHLIPPPEWKKGLGLSGSAPKAVVLEWAKARGLPVEDLAADEREDYADSLGVATYAAIQLEGWVPPPPT